MPVFGRGRRSAVLFLVVLLAASTNRVFAEPVLPCPTSPPPNSFFATAPADGRFFAAHGRKAIVMGGSEDGLEVWAYPFQIFEHYRLEFRVPGSPRCIDGAQIPWQIQYYPDHIVRSCRGLGYTVREDLFVPRDAPCALLHYEVTGDCPVELVVSCRPTMNLMWPAACGGQEVGWNDAIHGYVVSESTHGYRAVIASPQICEHADIVNGTWRRDLSQRFTLHPVETAAGKREAVMVVALSEPGETPVGREALGFLANEAALRSAAAEHCRAWLAESLSIVTPDKDLNRALQWATIDLDQAWVTAPRVGSALIAGYGPSRGTRRPQYDWFFAGDGLIATDALLCAGQPVRARDELTFIMQHQHPTSGMIWHEISQSAGFIDWAGKYPYLYAHVDITAHFLSTLDRYLAATGDAGFLKEHWTSIAAAFHYCQSLLSPDSGLPLIPADKMGGNEQDRMREDAGLSAGWIHAAEGYARLARATDHGADAADAAAMGNRARRAFANRYWSRLDQTWISGYTAAGKPTVERRSGPVEALTEHLFASSEETRLLDDLAGAAFQADWGTRSVSDGSLHYDPRSYSRGSVSALATAGVATAFWEAHRALSAWQIWSGLLPWMQLDSPGHMHEVLQGDVYCPQVESVPEQVWCEAGFLSAAVRGLAGIEVDVPSRHLTLAPQRVPGGGRMTVKGIQVAGSRVTAGFDWRPGAVDIDLSNDGPPVHLHLAPQVALGATDVQGQVAGRPAAVTREAWDQEQRASFDILLPGGTTHASVRYAGGVWLETPRSDPKPGAASRSLRIRGVHLSGRTLAVKADVRRDGDTSFTLDTPWTIASVEGGTVASVSPRLKRVTLRPNLTGTTASGYGTVTAHVRFGEAWSGRP